MVNQLFPTYDIPSVNEQRDRYYRDYKRTPEWDVKKGDFVMDAAHRIVESDGRNGYQIWCLKMSQTERFRCLAYRGCIGDMLGVEMENATFDDDHKTVESMMKRTITEAFMVNPRTLSVSDFEFEWDGDTVYGKCIVHAYDMDDFTLKF